MYKMKIYLLILLFTLIGYYVNGQSYKIYATESFGKDKNVKRQVNGKIKIGKKNILLKLDETTLLFTIIKKEQKEGFAIYTCMDKVISTEISIPLDNPGRVIYYKKNNNLLVLYTKK